MKRENSCDTRLTVGTRPGFVNLLSKQVMDVINSLAVPPKVKRFPYEAGSICEDTSERNAHLGSQREASGGALSRSSQQLDGDPQTRTGDDEWHAGLGPCCTGAPDTVGKSRSRRLLSV